MESQIATPVSFPYGEIQLSEAVMIHGIPHFTRRAIGEFLGYPDPVNAISTLIERNPYIQKYAATIPLKTRDGRAYKTTVYAPKGLCLLCGEANTKKSTEMLRLIFPLVGEYMWTKEAIAAFIREKTQPLLLFFEKIRKLLKHPDAKQQQLTFEL